MAELVHQEDGIRIYHGRAEDVAAAGLVDPSAPGLLILSDPPYGTGHGTDYGARGRSRLARAVDYEPIHGDDRPFDPRWLAPEGRWPSSILWGAPWYASRLPDAGGWLVWDKRAPGVSNDQADAELAWSNVVPGVRLFRHTWMGYWRDSERGEHHHPHQKPVALMGWCLDRLAERPSIVWDPYMGAGPVAVACQLRGIPYVGSEIVDVYVAAAVRRLAQRRLPL